MNTKRIILLIALISINYILLAHKLTYKHSNWEMNISNDGTIENIIFHNHKQADTIPFFDRKSANRGPKFYMELNNKTDIAKWKTSGYLSYTSSIDGIECNMKYTSIKNQPSIKLTITNNTHTTFQPQKAGIKLGVDTYMDKYPAWFNKYFPTLMRNERTHFYGYLESPKNKIIAIVSENPVASWSVDYNLGYQDPPPYWFMGHRIESLNIDLLNELPLPNHNPQNLYRLEPGEKKTWSFLLFNIKTLNKLEETIVKTVGIPLINFDKTSCSPGNKITFTVNTKNVKKTTIKLTNDNNEDIPINIIQKEKYKIIVGVNLPQVGLYKVTVKTPLKIAEGILSAHHTWKWEIEKAREAALIYHQKPTSHGESYYGFYSAFIAAKYFPNKNLDKQLSDRFNMIYSKLHKKNGITPSNTVNRIQNTAVFIGELIDKYEAEKDIHDLERAAKLADWLINNYQRKSDGAYFNGTVYTSVIYIAKSILELAIEEQKLGTIDPEWHNAYLRHYKSAKLAIDQLVSSKGNFQTEGEMTFEDGMISCSALQIGMLGNLQKDQISREHYAKAMLAILNSHDCLTQLKVPDARRRQGTMRFWEAQYDVQMLPNMFNSPHGWSAWRAYATYYAYLLTGNEKWLIQTFNAMGAFANLIDYKTGKLRWAFIVDPHLHVEQACSVDPHYTFNDVSLGNPHPKLYKTRKFTIGEQYIDMISNWQTVNTQDNDVHEIFKCMGETVLTNAFIVEHKNGSIKCYNCHTKKQGTKLIVTPNEKQITHLHCNLKHPLTINFLGKTKSYQHSFLGWFKD